MHASFEGRRVHFIAVLLPESTDSRLYLLESVARTVEGKVKAKVKLKLYTSRSRGVSDRHVMLPSSSFHLLFSPLSSHSLLLLYIMPQWTWAVV